MEQARGFPVRTKLYSKPVGGVPTDFSFSLYADRLLLIITQLGSAGTIMACSNDTAYDASAPTYSVAVLVGKREEPLLPLCARQIAEKAGQAGCLKTIIICLGLKEQSMASIRELVDIVLHNNVWA